MKTHRTDNSNLTEHGQIRLVLAIAGIAIAVLCSVALLHDMHAAESMNINMPRLMETARVGASDFVSKTMTSL